MKKVTTFFYFFFFLKGVAGGGVGQKNFHVVFREGLQNVHVMLLGGGRGQNFEKNCYIVYG